MKICFFGDAIQFHLRRWARYFADKGHDVSVITFNPNMLSGYDPVRVYAVRKKFSKPGIVSRTLSLLPLLINVKNLLKEINPDVIHIFSSSGYAWCATFTGFHPLIITPTGVDVLVEFKKSKIIQILTKYSLRKADIIHTDGDNVKKMLLDIGCAENKIKNVKYGVDVKKFKPDSISGRSIREKHKLGNSIIVVSTRRLELILGVETFVKAIPLVLKKIKNAKFLIAGYGPQKEYLINLAKKLDIYDSIRFLGMIEEDEMIRILQAAEVYVCTALSESGLAASTAEAMACGLPVINTDTGDINLWIKQGNGGFIIPPQNPSLLAEKIIFLLDNKEKRKEFGVINRRVVEDRNNYYKEMEKMENIYKELTL